MEIIAEISQDEYKQVIKDFYLKKDWAKHIAIQAIVALALALLGVKGYGWQMLYGFFVTYFFFIFLFFSVLPYGISYIKVRRSWDGIKHRPKSWIFDVSETGINTNNVEAIKFYKWGAISKIVKAGDHILFIPVSGNVFLLPVSSLDNENAEIFLAMISDYWHSPKKNMS